jgi:hypothetical protein
MEGEFEDAETTLRPSASTAMPRTMSEWPFKVRSSRPFLTFHTFSVLSSEAETENRPSRSVVRLNSCTQNRCGAKITD